MGTIKDIVDLTTELANSVQDRKIATELNNIQSLILTLQSEQALLHEKNIELREERVELKERIVQLEGELQRIRNEAPQGPEGIPSCPNCSTSNRPYYMRPVGPEFAHIMGASHECPQCKYTAFIEE